MSIDFEHTRPYIEIIEIPLGYYRTILDEIDFDAQVPQPPDRNFLAEVLRVYEVFPGDEMLDQIEYFFTVLVRPIFSHLTPKYHTNGGLEVKEALDKMCGNLKPSHAEDIHIFNALYTDAALSLTYLIMIGQYPEDEGSEVIYVKIDTERQAN